MKGAWFERFSQDYVLPRVHGSAAKGKFLFKVPGGAVYQGFIFDSSGFSKEHFYPQVYVQRSTSEAGASSISMGGLS
ncbi:MAG: hypothetical protein DMG39_17290 [Acidobacteria bacterium]|nr:MAG: hypothetical protein DMG39_17290 [Acidobacteriota bacterium]